MNESVAMAPLSEAILRFVDEVLMTVRWKYLRERLLGLLRTNASRFELLIEVKLCLEDHLELALKAAADVTRGHNQNIIPTTFRDLRWWLPEPLFDALGMHYMLVLWEDIVHEFYQSNCKSSHSVGLVQLGAAVRQGILEEIEKSTPDVIALELQSELLVDKLHNIPHLLCQFDIVKVLSRKLNEDLRSLLKRNTTATARRESTVAKQRRGSQQRQRRRSSATSMKPSEEDKLRRRASAVMPAERSDSEEDGEQAADPRRMDLAPSYVAFAE
jgi:hypothetical protein